METGVDMDGDTNRKTSRDGEEKPDVVRDYKRWGEQIVDTKDTFFWEGARR